jgi:hypothetical protein
MNTALVNISVGLRNFKKKKDSDFKEFKKQPHMRMVALLVILSSIYAILI